jgi:guanosine-3',5'-bis(diphosphate) 3'-pyrophosphohydrolase
VADALASEGGVSDLKTLMAAVLHDTVEDTDTTFEELAERFGTKVASIVKELTDEKLLSEVQRKREQVERAPQLTKRAALIRLADTTCNLWDIASHPPKDWLVKRKQAYFDWAKEVIDGLPHVNKKMRKAFDAALTLRPA